MFLSTEFQKLEEKLKAEVTHGLRLKKDIEVKEPQNLDHKTRAGNIFKILEASDF